jgi:hypothetical protein
LDPAKVGDEGLSMAGLWKDDSTDEVELGYLKCPRAENVGVVGEGISDADELWL